MPQGRVILEPDAGAIHAYRLDLELTQRELAERAGVSRGTIMRIEAGLAESISPRTLRGLLKALGLRPGDKYELIRYEHDPSSPDPATDGSDRLTAVAKYRAQQIEDASMGD